METKTGKQVRLDQINRYADMLGQYAGKAVRPYREDGFVNLMNKYGTKRDTTEHYEIEQDPPIPDDQLAMYYEENGLFSKIIDAPAEEALRKGFSLEGVNDEKITSFYTEALDELDWTENAMTAIKWARLFGGSVIVMLVNDGRGLEEPLDWKNIRSIDDMRVYDRSVIQPDYASMYSYVPEDPFRARGNRLGLPEYYNVFSQYGNFRVHESRCLVFQNSQLPENTTNSIYRIWGIPEYSRIKRALRDAEVAHGSAVKLLDRSVQAIYKMRNLSAEMATEQGEDLILKRLETIDMARGLMNSIVIDSDGEDYDFRSFQFAGVSNVIDATCNFLSAITNIPQTILFGRSPSGMNSTGDSDLENWYNYVDRIRQRMLKTNLRYLLSIIFQAGLSTGEADEVPKIKVEFEPLWSLTEQEQADLDATKAATEQTKAATAQTYVEMQALDPSEVRKKLADSDEFDIETILDEYSEEELFANEPQGEQGEGQNGSQNQSTPTSNVPNGKGIQTPTGEDKASQKANNEPKGNDESKGNSEPVQYGEAASVDEHEKDKGTEGSAPASAPAATKLPQDMSEEEKEEAEKAETNEDGGPGSGNWGHAGRPGHRGGSAPGGGKANRTGTAETGYSSAAKENVGGNDPCSSIATPERLAAIKRYLPTEGSHMWNEHQGWNKMRAEYLKELGHDEKDIAQLDAVASQHVAYAHTGDNSMKELAGRNSDILNDAAAYEVEAAKLRRQIKQQEADKYVEHQRTQKERLMAEIEAVENGEMEDLMGYGKHKEELIESADSKIKNAESRREQLNGPITLYRKGEYSHPVLSFSEDKGGTTLYKGTDYEVTLHPDHTNTLDELVSQGILPISGFGSVSNFYGESEVTFVNMRELTANSDTAMDGGPGSGNWGHAGRPGHVGGSSPRKGAVGSAEIAYPESGGPTLQYITKNEANKKIAEIIKEANTLENEEFEAKMDEAEKILADLPEGSEVTYVTDLGTEWEDKQVFRKMGLGSKSYEAVRGGMKGATVGSRTLAFDFLDEDNPPKITKIALTEEEKLWWANREQQTYWRNQETIWENGAPLTDRMSVKLRNRDFDNVGDEMVVTGKDGTRYEKGYYLGNEKNGRWYLEGTYKTANKTKMGYPTAEGDFFDICLGLNGISKRGVEEARKTYSTLKGKFKEAYDTVLSKSQFLPGDGAYWTPGTSKIHLGHDDDGSTIWHEAAHAFDDFVVDGGASHRLDKAMSEGTKQKDDFAAMKRTLGIKEDWDPQTANTEETFEASKKYVDWIMANHKGDTRVAEASDAVSALTGNALTETNFGGHDAGYWMNWSQNSSGHGVSNVSREYWANFCTLKAIGDTKQQSLLQQVTPNRYHECEAIYKEAFGDE